MSTGGGFEARSVSSLFTPMIAQGVNPQFTPEFKAMVAQGMDPATPVHLLGWVDNFPARQALAAQFAPPLSEVAPNLIGADQDVLLYKAWKEVLGSYPSYVAQRIGDCFPPDELIRTPGGMKPIGLVNAGEEVLTHRDRPRKVLRTIRKPYDGELVSFGVDNAYPTVASTPDHLFLTAEGQWVPSGKLTDGTSIRFARSGLDLENSVLRGHKRFVYRGDVCCLEVEEDRSFLANGFAAHNCTSFGSGHAVDLLQCIEIFLLKEASVYLEVCTEFIYGVGREIAGMLGGSDGCYGTAVAKALTDVGATTRKIVGPYDGNRAKQWGARGVPAEIKTAAAPFKVGSAALITTLAELDASLANLYPSAGGFSQGFTMHRDADGVCQQSGRWGHEQCCAGRRTRNGRRQYLLCQSWGPNVPDGPLTDDQPNFSFWIDEDPMSSILSQRDWLAFSAAPDFEKRPVPSKFRHSRMVG